MVKSLTIGLVDDGVATWNPVSDGNLLVTGGRGMRQDLVADTHPDTWSQRNGATGLYV